MIKIFRQLNADLCLSVAYQNELLEAGSRDDIIAWLVWNDGNGVYTDEDSEREGLPILTLESAREQMRKVLNES
jgi:hypothetical protein